MVLLGQWREDENKWKLIGREWWEFLPPAYYVYIEGPIHSQDKVWEEKKTTIFNLSSPA